jgi:virginiamycin B lyase
MMLPVSRPSRHDVALTAARIARATRRWTLLLAGAGAAATSAYAARGGAARGAAPGRPAAADTTLGLSSAELLALLPDGETKRRFVLDCTGCHQLDTRVAYPGGRARTEAEWEAAVARMLGYAGATTRFPVISHTRDPKGTAAWLARALPPAPPPAAASTAPATATVTEFLIPEPRDLPHDVAVDARGRVVITGMMTDRMYVLDPAANDGRGAFASLPIPLERANPRAVELDARGRWWVVLGAPGHLARFDPADSSWRTVEVGMYAHSVALAPDGAAWVNGHFTRAPELIARVDSGAGAARPVTMPPHPTLAATPGGPIPYEIRVAPSGTVWMSELHGNRLLAYDPRTGRTTTHEMPRSHMGPRRFDIDARGVLWIPAYTGNALVRFDPRTRTFREFPLPTRDAVPYVARVDARTGAVWIGTAAGDVVLRFDPASSRFTTYPLPSRGALVRHIALDPRTGDVWLAYGASPGIPARVARLRPGSGRR